MQLMTRYKSANDLLKMRMLLCIFVFNHEIDPFLFKNYIVQ